MNMELRPQSELTNSPSSAPAPTKDRAAIECWLVSKLASRLSVAPQQIDRESPILHLGLDSVDAMEVLGDIEESCRVTLDAEELFEQDPSVADIAGRIRALMDARTPETAGLGNDPRERTGAKRVEPSLPSRDERTESHPFAEYVNPFLADKLSRLDMDKRFVRGRGCYVEDREGRRYLDFVAQYGALPFGFNPPEIWEAVQAVRESGEPSFVQPSSLEAAGELARRLVGASPKGLAFATFSNSGAEAVEAAIKLSRAATGRMGILTTMGSFHGKTLGALSATGNPRYQAGFGAPAPDFQTVPFGDIEALEQALERAPDAYAAFIVEPIQGEGGIVEPPPGYLQRAQEAVQRTGALFVVDEIQTGLGRTGAMFACDSEGLAPDVVTVAKALGGGLLPIGATLCRREALTEAFATKHSSTFAGNTLACRVGIDECRQYTAAK